MQKRQIKCVVIAEFEDKVAGCTRYPGDEIDVDLERSRELRSKRVIGPTVDIELTAAGGRPDPTIVRSGRRAAAPERTDADSG